MSAPRGSERVGSRPSFAQELGGLLKGSILTNPEARTAAGLAVVGIYLYLHRDELKAQFERAKVGIAEAHIVARGVIQTVKEDARKQLGFMGSMLVSEIQKLGGSTLETFIDQFAQHADEFGGQLEGSDLRNAIEGFVRGFMHPEAGARRPSSPAKRVEIIQED